MSINIEKYDQGKRYSDKWDELLNFIFFSGSQLKLKYKKMSQSYN